MRREGEGGKGRERERAGGRACVCVGGEGVCVGEWGVWVWGVWGVWVVWGVCGTTVLCQCGCTGCCMELVLFHWRVWYQKFLLQPTPLTVRFTAPFLLYFLFCCC